MHFRERVGARQHAREAVIAAGVGNNGLGRLGGAGAVVGGVGVELVAAADGRGVGLRRGLTTVATICRVCGAAGATVPTSPDAGGAAVAALAGRRAHEGQAGRQQVGHLHVGGGVGALVGQRDGEGDRVADVGRRVADRLGQRQVGLLRRLGGAGRCCWPCSGRTGRRR